MNKKKIFILIALLFILAMAYLAYDMSSRTTSPWKRKKEILDKYKVK